MKRLGRGLSAILEDAEVGYLKDLGANSIVEIDLEKIKPNPFQPRKEFDENSINELANSIKEYGLLQPVVVIKDKDKYILVAGERRVRAFKKLNEKKIKAIVVDYNLNDLREYALIENIQRKDLSAFEIAISLDELIKKYNYTHEELAKKIGKSRSYVSNMLRLLNLPKDILEKIKDEKLSYGHAKVIINLPEERLKEVVEKIEKENLSVRDTEKIVKLLKNKDKEDEVVKKLRELGFEVKVEKGYLKIKYSESDYKKLKKILSKIK